MTSPADTPVPVSVAECLDRLEALLDSGGSMFGFGRRTARTEEARRLVQQVREALSHTTKRAAEAQAEAEAVLRRAQDDARRILLEAQERARGNLDAEVVRGAEHEAKELREQARRDADEVRRGADEYALGVFQRLDAEVTRVQATVRRAKTILGERTGTREPREPAQRLDSGKMASV